MSVEPTPPSGGIPPAGVGGINQTPLSAGAIQACVAVQSLFPGMQLARAVRSIRHPSAQGLSPDQERVAKSLRQQSDDIMEQMANDLGPDAWEGAQSFAALWYADRLGGHALAEQRERLDEENPIYLLAAADQLLEEAPEALGSREESETARTQLNRWQTDLQAAQAWKRGRFQTVLARDWSLERPSEARTEQFTRAAHWRGWLDEACLVPEHDDPAQRSAQVRLNMRRLLQDVPRGIPLRFDIRTDQASRHAVYAVLEDDPSDPQRLFLEVWNAGWGAVPASDGKIYPAVRLCLNDPIDAARALLALDAAEHFYHENLPLIQVLASLTLPNSVLELIEGAEGGSTKPFDMAVQTHLITYPVSEPVKAQRSGSCVAKGLRQWMQHTLGGSHAKESRRLLALLDLVAASILSLDLLSDTDAELRGLRCWLAGITAGYRWWKAVSRQTDPQELLLRSAATRAPQLPTPSPAGAAEQVYQAGFFASPALVPALPEESKELHPGLRLDRMCADLREAAIRQDLVGLKERWNIYQGWKPCNPCQELAPIMFEGYVKGPSEEFVCGTPDIVEYEIWDIGLTLWGAVEQIQNAAPQDADLVRQMTETGEAALNLLRALISFTPRPGLSEDDWANADAAWQRLPYFGKHLGAWPTFQGIEDIDRAMRDLELSMTQLVQSWTISRGVRERFPLIDFTKTPYSLILHIRRATQSQPLPPGSALELAALQTLTGPCRTLICLSDVLKGAPGTAGKRALPSFFRRLHRANDLAERTQMLRNTKVPAAREPQTLAIERGLLGSIAMETGGLTALLTSSVASGQPLLALPNMLYWTPPLGSGAPPAVQGDLLVLGGFDAWQSWLHAAIDHVDAFGTPAEGRERDQQEHALLGLAAMAHQFCVDVLLPVTGPHAALLKAWDRLLRLAAPHCPRLTAAAAWVQLLLSASRSIQRGLPPALDEQAVLGDLQTLFAECPWLDWQEQGTSQSFCQMWGLLRELQGLPDPWTVHPAQADGKIVEIDLHHARTTGTMESTLVQAALSRMSPPAGWTRVHHPMFGEVLTHRGPSVESTLIRTEHGAPFVEWDSSFGRKEMGALLRPPGAQSPARAYAVDAAMALFPVWDSSDRDAGTAQQPFPLHADQIVWYGDRRPKTDDDWRSLQAERESLPAIFWSAPIIQTRKLGRGPRGSGARSRDYGMVATGTLRETGRLVRADGTDCLQFPDGEQIPLLGHTRWGPLSVIGQTGPDGRVCLEELAMQGTPVRGTIRGAGRAGQLELDSGWTVAPEQWEDLPPSLHAVVRGADSLPRTVAMPLVRRGPAGGQELAMLIGRPASRGGQGAGEMIILRVRPTGDLEVEPGTSWDGVIALLAHLARFAPSVLPRVLQALADADPSLTVQSKQTLLDTLKHLQLEGGAGLRPFLEEALRAYSPTRSREDAIRARQALLSRRGAEVLLPPILPESPPARDQETLRDLHCSPVSPQDAELLGAAKEALRNGQREAAQQVLSQLISSLQRQQHAAHEAVELAFTDLLPQDAALLQTRFGLDPSAILNGWFQAEQTGSSHPWANLLRGVSPPAQIFIQRALTGLMVATLRLRASEHLVDQLASADSIGSTLKRLEVFETRVAGRLPLSQLRQEWLFGILGRPQQSEILERWGRGEGGPRQLLEVGMGGGKTSFLNPAIALEMAHQNFQQDPSAPEAVLVVVPDALEEDAKRLCYQQGWDLMGASMPFVGSGGSADQVVEAAQGAAARALPLTLTQSAWNFAWLELIHRIESGPELEAQRAHRQLSILATASILLDEADRALALDQSFNLESQPPQPLPPFLLEALDRWIALRSLQTCPFLAPLDRQEQIDFLVSLAPREWDAELVQRVANALVNRQSIDELEGLRADAMAAGALLLFRSRATAQQLQDEKTAYGPATDDSLEVVPYQSAFWPTSQKFSDPALVGLLTLAQAEDPSFWTAERTQALQPQLREWSRSSPALQKRLREVGLSPEIRTDWRRLQTVLQSSRTARLQIGRLLCQSRVSTAGRVLKLSASGAPLRGRRCLASTGTPPSAAQTPTSLAGALPLAPPDPRLGPDVLSVCQSRRVASLDDALEKAIPHILIDPAGMLDRERAAQMGLRMAQDLVRSGVELRPPMVLTWSEGSSQAPPKLERILPSGSSDAAPSQAALAQLPKVVVYQQAQCRGTDLKPRQGERGLLYLDAPIPLRDLQQAAARLRGLPATAGAAGTQSLVIAIGPNLARQLDELRQHHPIEGDDLSSLRALCDESERSHDAGLIPELLKQDLASLRQAAALWSLTATPAPNRELATILQGALQEEFHYPTLWELSSGASDGESQKRALLAEAQRFEGLLERVLQDQPELEQILEGLKVWRERLMGTPDALLVRSETAPSRSFAQVGVARALEEVQERRSQQQQQAEAQIQQSLALLRDAASQRTSEQLAREVLWIEASWDPDTRQIRGALQRGLCVRDIGILGFERYWQAKGGAAADELVPPSLAVSPAALLPLGAPLAFDDPLRLEPQLLHTKTATGWQSALIAPQEAAEMQFSNPQEWRKASERGEILLTSLSGAPLTGLLGPDLDNESRVLHSLVKDRAFQSHLDSIVRSTRQLRACFGSPMPPLSNDQEREELAWLGSNLGWSQVWLEMSPTHLRPGRLETVRQAGAKAF